MVNANLQTLSLTHLSNGGDPARAEIIFRPNASDGLARWGATAEREQYKDLLLDSWARLAAAARSHAAFAATWAKATGEWAHVMDDPEVVRGIREMSAAYARMTAYRRKTSNEILQALFEVRAKQTARRKSVKARHAAAERARSVRT